jgi:hypothetical protein
MNDTNDSKSASPGPFQGDQGLNSASEKGSSDKRIAAVQAQDAPDPESPAPIPGDHGLKAEKATSYKQTTAAKTQDPPDPISAAIADYVQSLRSIHQTVSLVLPHVSNWLIQERTKGETQLGKFIPGFPNHATPTTIRVDAVRDLVEVTSTLRTLQDAVANNAPAVIIRSLFLYMFSEFDVFSGALLNAIYVKNDKLLSGISRTVTLGDLLQYENLEAVKRALLDKEIETFRRDSYVEQFATIERKFGISLRKFKEWSEFVEVGQRRNIFTHNGGVVTDQYLLVCEAEGHKFAEKPALGRQLDLNVKYLLRALTLLSKVGIMLGFTLWSKVFPKEHTRIHTSLNEMVYKCLEGKRWKLVAELEDFVLSPPMYRNVAELDARMRRVNVAIGLKFSGRTDDAVRVLREVDWSASYRDFRLAIAVLEENYVEAINIMEAIGKSGEILKQSGYHTWPLFTKFRELPEFYAAYERIYGEPFSANVTPDSEQINTVVLKPKPKIATVRAHADGVIDISPITTVGANTPSNTTNATAIPQTEAISQDGKLQSQIKAVDSTSPK